MSRVGNSFLWATRAMAIIGLLALTLTDEIGAAWGIAAWLCWGIGLLMDRRPDIQISLRKTETVAVVGLIAFVIADFAVYHQTLFVVVAHFLLLFSMFKTIGPKERRDGMQIGVISFFQLLAACTLSADVWQALLLFALIPSGTALLYWNQVERVRALSTGTAWPEPPIKRMHRAIALGGIPFNLAITLILFVGLPRLTFNVQIPGFGTGKSSYTDQVNLDRQGTIDEDNSVAVWVAFPDDSQRERWNKYLRGDVMETFDGKQWSNNDSRPLRQFSADNNRVFTIEATPPGSHSSRITVTLLNTTKNTLFMPGAPLRIMAPLQVLQQSHADTWRWIATLSKPLRYDVYSVLEQQSLSESGSIESLEMYRHLPEMSVARIAALASQVAGTGSAGEQAQRLEQYLRATYAYSLDYGTLSSINPVEDFLFVRKQGSCGHFASAMAVMLRLQGIPSRIVAGYHGGEWNAPAQQILIREKHAHAWVEALIDGTWRTFDPTPLSIDLAGGQSRSIVRRAQLSVRQYWDYGGYLWNRFIIEYDMQTQWRTFSKLGQKSGGLGLTFLQRWLNLSPQTPASQRAPQKKNTPFLSPFTITVLTLLFGGIVAVWVWRANRRRGTAAPIPPEYARFLRRMERAGLPRQPWETASEFSSRARAKFPAESSQIDTITTSYTRKRFGG